LYLSFLVALSTTREPQPTHTPCDCWGAECGFNSALERFLKGRSGFPNFKRKKCGDFFTVDSSNGQIFLRTGNRIKIPTLGTFRLKEAIRYNCCSQTFTINRTADKWYVSFTIKADKILPLYHSVSEITGIDLGVFIFAILSDGTVYQLPNSLKKRKSS